MKKITREDMLKELDDDLLAELEGEPGELEMAVKEFLDNFERDYRARIAARS